MPKKVLIQITGLQTIDGELQDKVELTTLGQYTHDPEEASYSIVYDESELTGYEGCRTTIRICADGKVTLQRHQSPLLVDDAAPDGPPPQQAG